MSIVCYSVCVAYNIIIGIMILPQAYAQCYHSCYGHASGLLVTLLNLSILRVTVLFILPLLPFSLCPFKGLSEAYMCALLPSLHTLILTCLFLLPLLRMVIFSGLFALSYIQTDIYMYTADYNAPCRCLLRLACLSCPSLHVHSWLPS